MTKSPQPEPKCPGCKRTLTDPKEYDSAKGEFERRVNDMHLELSRKEKKEFATMLRDLKIKHRVEMQRLRTDFRQKEVAFRKKATSQLKSEKVSYKQKMESLRRDHQISLQNTREVYETQSLIAQKEREGLFNNQLREILEDYSSLAASYQKELEGLRKVQNDYGKEIRKMEAEIARLKISIVKSTSDPQLGRLMVQLGERDATIDDLRSKVTELESKLLAAPSTNKDEDATETHAPISAVSSQAGNREAGSFSISGGNDNIQGMQDKPSPDNSDPRELFINAIKEINRNLKRPHEKVPGKEEAASDPLGSGEAIVPDSTSKEAGSDASPTKTTKFRKWFA
jgi:hypothetical protein